MTVLSLTWERRSLHWDGARLATGQRCAQEVSQNMKCKEYLGNFSKGYPLYTWYILFETFSKNMFYLEKNIHWSLCSDLCQFTNLNMTVRYHYAGINRMAWKQIKKVSISHIFNLYLKISKIKLVKTSQLQRNRLWKFWVYILIVSFFYWPYELVLQQSCQTIKCNVTKIQVQPSAVITRHNNIILHTSLQELRQNINQRLNPQKTPHTLPWRASYGVSFANILEKIDRALTAPQCTWI